MEILSTVFVCTVRLADGVHLGCVWDGGPTIAVHVDRHGQAERLADWPVWNEAWDSPLIEATRESFQRFVAARVSEGDVLTGWPAAIRPAVAAPNPAD